MEICAFVFFRCNWKPFHFSFTCHGLSSGMCKNHKPTPVGRPIISGCDAHRLPQPIAQLKSGHIKEVVSNVNDSMNEPCLFSKVVLIHQQLLPRKIFRYPSNVSYKRGRYSTCGQNFKSITRIVTNVEQNIKYKNRTCKIMYCTALWLASVWRPFNLPCRGRDSGDKGTGGGWQGTESGKFWPPCLPPLTSKAVCLSLSYKGT